MSSPNFTIKKILHPRLSIKPLDPSTQKQNGVEAWDLDPRSFFYHHINTVIFMGLFFHYRSELNVRLFLIALPINIFLDYYTWVQCFGSGFVFYGSGSWISPPIRIPDPDPGNKNKYFQSKNKIFWEIFVLTQKVGRYFIFVFNQSSRYFIKQRTFVWCHF